MSSNRWLIIALIVSVGSNLALVGFLLGRASFNEFRPDLMNPMWGVAGMLRDLPAPRREVLRPQLRNHLSTLRPDARQVRRAQQSLRAALLADPFDSAELTLVLERLSDHLHSSQTASHAAFAALIESLTVEERALLVRRMQHRTDGPRHIRNGRDPSRHDLSRQRPFTGPPTSPPPH